jgi:hypothetical protein
MELVDQTFPMIEPALVLPSLSLELVAATLGSVEMKPRIVRFISYINVLLTDCIPRCKE